MHPKRTVAGLISLIAAAAISTGCAPAGLAHPEMNSSTQPIQQSNSTTGQPPATSATPSLPPSASSTPTTSINPAPPTSVKPAPPTSAPPATASSTATPSATVLPRTGGRTVTINYSGDLLWHTTLFRGAILDAQAKGGTGMDFEPQLKALTPYVSKADFAICHSEVPFAKAGGPYTGYPMFKAPPEIAKALPKIGWDLCTTASNHSLDAGFDGLVRTIELHNKVGILTSGTYASEQASKTPVIFTTASGVKISVISTTYGTNGIPLPKGKKWSVQLMDIEQTLAAAKRAKQAGANIVVVHMHAGTEYNSKPNSQQRAFAAAITASPDIDLLVGQHAHVVQPITRVNNKWVAYGAGNLIAQSGPAKPYTFDGYLATFSFTEQIDGSFKSSTAEFAPTFITKATSSNPARVYVISEALAKGNGDTAALRASAARTRKVVRSMGAGESSLREH